jgi:DNA-binding NarL/FixJ family response regulator
MPSAKPVLLVDDNAMPRRVLAEQLAGDGVYTVIEAGSAAEARAAQGYVFAIIDGALEGSGTLGRELRAQGFEGPVLLLTDRQRANICSSRSALPRCWRGCPRIWGIMALPRTGLSPSGLICSGRAPSC